MKQFFNSEKKKNLFIKYSFLFVLFISLYIILKGKNIYEQDDITLVTSLFKIKSKYSFNNYLNWTKNLLKKNISIVFFIDKSIYKIIKNMRPNIYNNKTVWIQINIENFYSYKNYIEDFIETHKIDPEKKIHTIFLYLVWAEKCYFVRKAINRNYFNSKCFYWIDAGFFRKDVFSSKKWPSPNKCIQDPRVIINSMRKFSNLEVEALKNLNVKLYNNFIIKRRNVGGGLFGGQPKYLIKFINLYYQTIKKFIKKKMFIGKDQNIFAYISYFNKDIVNIIHSEQWFYFNKYLAN